MTFYYWDSEVVEHVIDLIFVHMLGIVVDFDFELGLEVINWLEEFD